MHPYCQLALAGAMPVLVSVILYLLDKKTAFGKIKYGVKQVIFGVIFGGLAVLSTEFGISVLGVTMNVRDAAPICAGLIFGSPAGVIAGVIGGVERFIAASWGAGEYTKIACSVSTIFAGLFAAWLRKFMFDDKKPAWYYGLATGIIVEVIHMLMVFLTNISDARNAFPIVQKCAIPMITLSGLAVMLAVLLVSLLGKEKFRLPKYKTKITQDFQKWLLICVLVAFCVTGAFTAVLQSGVSDASTKELLEVNIADVEQDITDAANANLLSITREVATEINTSGSTDNKYLRQLKAKYNVAEIDIINRDGIITSSTIDQFIGFDMHNGEQAAEFLVLLDGTTKEFVQEYQNITYDNSISRKYAGVVLNGGGFVQVAYDTERFQQDISEEVIGITRNRHIGENGYILICDEDFNIVSDRQHEGENLDVTGIYIYLDSMSPGEHYTTTVSGEESYWMYTFSEGYYIIAVLPLSEALFSKNLSIYLTQFMEVIVFAALLLLIYFLTKKLIVDNIGKVNDSLAKITAGDLSTTVNVRSNEEFTSLSDDINSTVDTLRHYIDEAAARIDKELEFAKAIQTSSLPHVFPKSKQFELWAYMNTAKEVGGDFYDFYPLGNNKLAFMIADVSGKGIPAALFMMKSKTMLKNMAEADAEVNDIFTHANDQLCENNDAGMFVTAWMGILDLNSGVVTFANAGHNPPLVRKADGSFEYLRSRAGFVLAGMDGICYRKNELKMEPGDVIYLYTDGVTEATNAENQLYGEERLLNKINTMKDSNVEEICRAIKEDVDLFVGEAPQFDDITMVCLKYKNKPEMSRMNELTIEATIPNIETVTEFVDAHLEAMDCPMKAQVQINIAIDELFSNIAKFAYAPETGKATVRFETETDPATAAVITFIDNGIPYDPLSATEPDINLSAEEREIGGLGIFMVKKSMDDIQYEYKDGQNILRIKKILK